MAADESFRAALPRNAVRWGLQPRRGCKCAINLKGLPLPPALVRHSAEKGGGAHCSGRVGLAGAVRVLHQETQRRALRQRGAKALPLRARAVGALPRAGVRADSFAGSSLGGAVRYPDDALSGDALDRSETWAGELGATQRAGGHARAVRTLGGLVCFLLRPRARRGCGMGAPGLPVRARVVNAAHRGPKGARCWRRAQKVVVGARTVVAPGLCSRAGRTS